MGRRTSTIRTPISTIFPGVHRLAMSPQTKIRVLPEQERPDRIAIPRSSAHQAERLPCRSLEFRAPASATALPAGSMRRRLGREDALDAAFPEAIAVLGKAFREGVAHEGRGVAPPGLKPSQKPMAEDPEQCHPEFRQVSPYFENDPRLIFVAWPCNASLLPRQDKSRRCRTGRSRRPENRSPATTRSCRTSCAADRRPYPCRRWRAADHRAIETLMVLSFSSPPSPTTSKTSAARPQRTPADPSAGPSQRGSEPGT